MGNRCLIVPVNTETGVYSDLGIYLHWYGHRSSVEAFLEYARRAELPSMSPGPYEPFDLAGVVEMYRIMQNTIQDPGHTVYLSAIPRTLSEADSPGDNGIFIVDGFDIIGRIDGRGTDSRVGYDLDEFMLTIDSRQPKNMQLGEAFLTAKRIPVAEVKPGDLVYRRMFTNTQADTHGAVHGFEPLEVAEKDFCKEGYRAGELFVGLRSYEPSDTVAVAAPGTPSVTVSCRTEGGGTIYKFEVDGQLHRLDGPALIEVRSGEITYQAWYRHGQPIPPQVPLGQTASFSATQSVESGVVL